MAGIAELLPAEAGGRGGAALRDGVQDRARRRPARRSRTSGSSRERVRARDRLGERKGHGARRLRGRTRRPARRGNGGRDREGVGPARRADRRSARVFARVRAERSFPPPTLETVVRPAQEADKAALHLALTQLAEQDPLIDVRQDDERQEFALSLYGEVQKEVIAATLEADYGVAVTLQRDDAALRRAAAAHGRGGGAAEHASRIPSRPRSRLRIEPAAGRGRRDVPAGGGGADASAVRVQDRRALRRAHGRVRPAGHAEGAVRLAGRRLGRHADGVRVRGLRRPAVEARAAHQAVRVSAT